MNATMKEKKAEAGKRMRALGIYRPTVQQFTRQDILSACEGPFGACYWVEGDSLEHVREFEEENNALVYLVIRCRVGGDEVENYLYVSDHPEDWALDWQDLKQGMPVARAYNVSCPWCSDTGHIGIRKTAAAGLRRVW